MMVTVLICASAPRRWARSAFGGDDNRPHAASPGVAARAGGRRRRLEADQHGDEDIGQNAASPPPNQPSATTAPTASDPAGEQQPQPMHQRIDRRQQGREPAEAVGDGRGRMVLCAHRRNRGSRSIPLGGGWRRPSRFALEQNPRGWKLRDRQRSAIDENDQRGDTDDARFPRRTRPATQPGRVHRRAGHRPAGADGRVHPGRADRRLPAKPAPPRVPIRACPWSTG